MDPLRADSYDYCLDELLIAQSPLPDRAQSRLMVLDRSAGQVSHRAFRDLPQILRPGDLLVVNDTKVIPARFFCRRASGGKIEGLFLREIESRLWQVLLKGAGRCRPGEKLHLEPTDIELELIENQSQGQWLIRVRSGQPAQEILALAGQTPLPPYIHRAGGDQPDDRDRYQTVYAQKAGAVAAPTAGLHFTRELLDELADRDIGTTGVTLHVGMGTFLPVKEEDITLHRMHSEWYELSPQAAAAISLARSQRRRVIAVGTTSVRVLESVAAAQNLPALPDVSAQLAPASGWTDIFIHPPCEFRIAQALITNFHLPRSTLMMLVSAFAAPGELSGIALVKAAYAAAQQERYRFFSYGDAMLIV